VKKVLVVADQSTGKNDKQLALQRALNLLDNQKGSITLVGFCYFDLKNSTEDLNGQVTEKKLQKLLMDQRQQELKQYVDELKTDTPIKVQVIWEKHISAWISSHVKETQYDCVIKSGSHSANSWRHTPTDLQLFKACSTPVMVVANKSWKKKAHVLVALDLTSKKALKQTLNQKLIAEAQKLCETLQAKMHVVYAVEVPRVLADLDLLDERKFVSNKRKEVEPVIEQLCSSYDIGEKNVHIKQGEAHRVVPSIANKIKADIVVAGTVNKKGISKFLGSTAEEMLGKLYTDIYVIKP